MKVKDVWNVISTDNDLDVIDIETGELYAYTAAVNGNRNLHICFPDFSECEDVVLNVEVEKLEVDGWHRATLMAWVRLYSKIYG